VTSIFTKAADVHEIADPKQLVDECVCISHVVVIEMDFVSFRKNF